MSSPAGPGGARRPERGVGERLLLHLGHGVTHLHPDDLARFVLDAGRLLGATDLSLLLVDLDQRHLRPLDPSRGQPVDADAAPALDGAFPVEGSGPGEAYRHERTVIEHGTPGVVRLWLPIMDAAERLGILDVTLPGAPGDVDLELWQAVASIVGETLVAKSAYGDGIARTRRSQDLTLAAEMRWSTLPPLTFTSLRVQVAGVLEPAYDIAGDTFDYAINGEVVSVAVLDAMGHGLEASQIANLALGELRRCRRSRVGLADTIRSIDDVIVDQFGEDRYITGQFAELDLSTGLLRIINAGHPRPLLFKGGRDRGDLQCTPNRPLGLGLVRTEVSDCTIDPGDVVIFHTDGIIEARDEAGRELGRERLASLVEVGLQAEEPPSEILRRVARHVHAHTGGPLRDDASLVFLRRR